MQIDPFQPATHSACTWALRAHSYNLQGKIALWQVGNIDRRHWRQPRRLPEILRPPQALEGTLGLSNLAFIMVGCSR